MWGPVRGTFGQAEDIGDLPPQIFSLAWSPDGKKLATVSKDGRLRLYEPRSSPLPQQVQSGWWGQAGELGTPPWAPAAPSALSKLIG